jgi:hypothetical protein
MYQELLRVQATWPLLLHNASQGCICKGQEWKFLGYMQVYMFEHVCI